MTFYHVYVDISTERMCFFTRNKIPNCYTRKWQKTLRNETTSYFPDRKQLYMQVNQSKVLFLNGIDDATDICLSYEFINLLLIFSEKTFTEPIWNKFDGWIDVERSNTVLCICARKTEGSLSQYIVL